MVKNLPLTLAIKKIGTRLISIIILISILIQFSSSSFAQYSYPKGNFKTEVAASIGEFYLNVSGFISPYASIVLTSKGIFYRATVADKNGNFSLSQILINKGFSGFCLTAIDFKRLGESTTCFSFPPATETINMHGLFLPPTLGLSRAEIAAGSSVLAFGYTMPGATVTIYINGLKLTTTADSTGYYEFKISDVKAGTYQLFAKAQYKGKNSLSPTKYLRLKALSLWEQFIAFLKKLWHDLVQILTAISLGPLWLGLPIIILIIILILKLWPERFTFIYESKLAHFFTKLFRKERKLHHAWWVGY